MPADPPEKAGAIGSIANGAAPASALARAKEIHGALHAGAQGRVTTAVAETAEGVRVVGSSEGSLRGVRRAGLQSGEVAPKGIPRTHAEVNVVNGAKALGLTPKSVSPSRPACANCQDTLRKINIKIKDK